MTNLNDSTYELFFKNKLSESNQTKYLNIAQFEVIDQTIGSIHKLGGLSDLSPNEAFGLVYNTL